jgi:hypothetical protein
MLAMLYYILRNFSHRHVCLCASEQIAARIAAKSKEKEGEGRKRKFSEAAEPAQRRFAESPQPDERQAAPWRTEKSSRSSAIPPPAEPTREIPEHEVSCLVYKVPCHEAALHA